MFLFEGIFHDYHSYQLWGRQQTMMHLWIWLCVF